MVRFYTIQARAAANILRVAAQYGVSQRTLLEAAGLKPELPADRDTRIPFQSVVALYELAAEHTGDPLFGAHAGVQMAPGNFDLLGYAAANCPTLRGFFVQIMRLLQLWEDGTVVRLVNQRPGLWVHYDIAAIEPRACRQKVEAVLSIGFNLGRQLTGIDWSPDRVELRHDVREQAAALEAFFGAPVRFGCPEFNL